MAALPHRIALSLVALVALASTGGAGADSATSGKAAAPSSHHLSFVATMNPHLHAPAPSLAAHSISASAHSAAPAKPVVEHVEIKSLHSHLPIVRVVHETWIPRWDAHTFIALHRGLATISGIAHDAAGKPVGGVRVALQHPGGRPFASIALKHVTFSSANGSFVMTNVRPGTYRVFAQINRKKARVRKAVHANQTESLSIKI